MNQLLNSYNNRGKVHTPPLNCYPIINVPLKLTLFVYSIGNILVEFVMLLLVEK
jgi:hypothetical protein